jgi:hypothetical protein
MSLKRSVPSLAQLTIEAKFNGPDGSANGGYTCGRIAEHLGCGAEVMLRMPPPLERPLDVERDDERLLVRDGEFLVAEAVQATVELDAPVPPSWEAAEAASTRYPGLVEHAFPRCFVCGPAREPGDGLRIFAGRLGDGLFAATWTPSEVAPELVWAALDCPGAIAVGFPDRGETLLGRFAVRIERLPAVGESCIVLAWSLGEEGRKLYAATALYGEDSRLLAKARATWIVPR